MKITGNDISELFDRVKALEKKLGVTHVPKGLKIGDEFKLADVNWKILDITDAGYIYVLVIHWVIRFLTTIQTTGTKVV